MTHYISLISGDGIGPEIINSVKKVIKSVKVPIIWHEVDAGLSAIKKYGCALPETTLDSIKSNKVALKGPTTTPIGTGHKSVNVDLRQKLNLYACIRPVKSIINISKYQDIDLVIMRENTEGLYCGKEIEISPGTIISLKLSTQKACDRIISKAFKYCQIHNRKKVTVAHKANILKMGDGLFLDISKKYSKKYKLIEYSDVIIDALCMHLVLNPQQFDIIVLENLYGDIISDLCAGLVGGLGLLPGANIGEEYAVFEAIHGSAPEIAGKNIANPVAILKSLTMLLDHINEKKAALAITQAINYVLTDKNKRTVDIGGQASTDDFIEHIIKEL